jgi:hypothetical protein
VTNLVLPEFTKFVLALAQDAWPAFDENVIAAFVDPER